MGLNDLNNLKRSDGHLPGSYKSSCSLDGVQGSSQKQSKQTGRAAAEVRASSHAEEARESS